MASGRISQASAYLGLYTTAFPSPKEVADLGAHGMASRCGTGTIKVGGAHHVDPPCRTMTYVYSSTTRFCQFLASPARSGAVACIVRVWELGGARPGCPERRQEAARRGRGRPKRQQAEEKDQYRGRRFQPAPKQGADPR